MKQYIYSLLLVLATSFLFSCEKDIEFKGYISDPKLVMNGVVSPYSAISIQLTKSRFVLSNDDTFSHIANATVSMLVNGEPGENLVYEAEGVYKSDYIPKPGDHIEITVEAKGFDKAYSQTTIPMNPEVTVRDSSVAYIESEQASMYDPNMIFKYVNRIIDIQLGLKDNANEENYYFIKTTLNQYLNDELIHSTPLYFELSQVLKGNITEGGNVLQEIFDNVESSYLTGNLFSDRFVNGKDIFFDFSYNNLVGADTYVNGEKVDDENVETVFMEHVIEIGSMTSDYYNYLMSADKALSTEDSGPFSEPVMIHTNIENGIGILGAYSSYRFISRFETNINSFYYTNGY